MSYVILSTIRTMIYLFTIAGSKLQIKDVLMLTVLLVILMFVKAAVQKKHGRAIIVTTLALSLAQFSNAVEAEPVKKLQMDDFVYRGAFRLPLKQYGDSSLAWSNGSMALGPDGTSIFVVGHVADQAIAEFRIPELVRSENLRDLQMASAPIQPFSRIIPKAPTGNPDSINTITGLFFYNERLIVNGIDAYDGDANNKHTTLVIESPHNLAQSKVAGFYELSCAARCSGWMSPIPSEWQPALGGGHIVGFASNYSINARFSMGPSAFVFSPGELLEKLSSSSTSSQSALIQAEVLQVYSLDNELHPDRANNSLANELWTELSMAIYGFIVPGTSTYVTVGNSGGHSSGIAYKIRGCGGFCAIDPNDYYNYVWFWDVNDLMKVKNGEMAPHELKPYWYGEFKIPFQQGEYGLIMGADYDRKKSQLYLLLRNADGLQSQYDAAPVVVAYDIVLNRPNPPGHVHATPL